METVIECSLGTQPTIFQSLTIFIVYLLYRFFLVQAQQLVAHIPLTRRSLCIHDVQ